MSRLEWHLGTAQVPTARGSQRGERRARGLALGIEHADELLKFQLTSGETSSSRCVRRSRRCSGICVCWSSRVCCRSIRLHRVTDSTDTLTSASCACSIPVITVTAAGGYLQGVSEANLDVSPSHSFCYCVMAGSCPRCWRRRIEGLRDDANRCSCQHLARRAAPLSVET